MSRMGKIRIITFSVAAFVVAVAFAITNYIRVTEYRRAYELTYRRAFTSLCDSVTKIDSELSKSIYSTSSPLLVTVANNISRYSENAKNALSILPTSNMSLDKTNTFISQVGDFSVTLARKAASGTGISQDEVNSLKSLSETASQLSSELSELYLQLDNEDFFSASSADVLKNAENAESGVPIRFSDGIMALESNMPESPVLIYDGPYSSHILQAVPQYMMKGDAEISQDAAGKKAAEFLGVPESSVTFLTKTEGNEIVYTFSAAGDAEYFISVTAVGGHVISFSSSFIPGPSVFEANEAVTIGASFLADRGFEKLTPSYYYMQGGICYINYEYTEGNVVIYPDLVQLGVALDTGKVTYMDASGYLNNNRPGRDLNATLSANEAAESLSPELTINRLAGLCVIPSLGQNEILCYEFECTGGKGDTFLVYVNAKTGVIENIFLLVMDENGTLTV